MRLPPELLDYKQWVLWRRAEVNGRITKIPMRQDSRTISHVITIGEDITEWRQAQQRLTENFSTTSSTAFETPACPRGIFQITKSGNS